MTAADVLTHHSWRGDILGCGCGWNWPEERSYFCGEEERISKAHVEHQVDALKDAGFSVVELRDVTEFEALLLRDWLTFIRAEAGKFKPPEEIS